MLRLFTCTFIACLRISITFRRMDESKRPKGYAPEPDLQDIQPLSYEEDKIIRLNTPRGERQRQASRRVGNSEMWGSAERSHVHPEPHDSAWSRRGSGIRWNRGRGVNVNFGT